MMVFCPAMANLQSNYILVSFESGPIQIDRMHISFVLLCMIYDVCSDIDISLQSNIEKLLSHTDDFLYGLV